MTTDDWNRAVATADAVLDELEDRKGFDWWWDDLDEEIQVEIREAIAERIRAAYPGGTP